MANVFILLIALPVVAAAVYGYYARQKRRNELSALAASKGWSFDPGRDEALEARFPGLKCLHQGDGGRYAFNIMTGQAGGRDVSAFDYHYITRSSDSRGRRHDTNHYFSAVILAGGVVLKPLFIRPEGLLDKLAAFFGADDIDFESAEFSRRFYVKAPDKRWAYDVIHPRTMEFLLAMPRFHIQFDLVHAVAWRDKRLSPAEFLSAIDTLNGVLDRLPEYVLRQQKGEA